MMPTGERGWRACREELVGMHVSFLLSSTFGRGRLEEGLTRRGRGVWMEVAAKNEVLRREREVSGQPGSSFTSPVTTRGAFFGRALFY